MSSSHGDARCARWLHCCSSNDTSLSKAHGASPRPSPHLQAVAETLGAACVVYTPTVGKLPVFFRTKRLFVFDFYPSAASSAANTPKMRLVGNCRQINKLQTRVSLSEMVCAFCPRENHLYACRKEPFRVMMTIVSSCETIAFARAVTMPKFTLHVLVCYY